MTIVSKASAYPKSVQSGLPRLGTCPPGWTRGPLSAHLTEELRPLNMADDEVYNLVTVKRSRGGVVLRERLKGSEIAVKTQFRLKAGDFLISKRQIVHGACGIVPPMVPRHNSPVTMISPSAAKLTVTWSSGRPALAMLSSSASCKVTTEPHSVRP